MARANLTEFEEIITLSELAQALGVSRFSVQDFVRFNGVRPIRKIGCTNVYDRKLLDEMRSRLTKRRRK